MAQRFGGKYSPNGQSKSASPSGSYDRAEVNPVGARANLLFVPPVMLLVTTLFGGALSLVMGLVGAALLSGSAYLLRAGLVAQAEFDARKVARRPAFPRKLAAALLMGLGIGVAGLAHGSGTLAAVLYGLACGGLFGASFGLDPMRDKGMEGIDTFQQDRVARVVDEAEDYLKAMKDAVLRASDRAMEVEVDRFQTVARDLIRTVEEDPRDLTAARKYLGVYLRGARDATVKFADIFSRTKDAQARADYAALLGDLSDNFSARTRKLLRDDRSDLTVEIDVLRDRLAREGVRLGDDTDT